MMDTQRRTGLSLALAAALAAGALVGCDTEDTTTPGVTPPAGTTPGGTADVDAVVITADVDKPAGTTSGDAAVGGAAAGATTNAAAARQSGSGPAGAGQAGASAKQAVAKVEPSKAPGQDDVRGTVTFTPADKGLRVQAEISGLPPTSTHGFHIHESGDLSAPDLSSAGGHFNPEGHTHGGPETDKHHAGDLGNLQTDAKGVARYDKVIRGISLDEAKTSIIGKSVIVHAKADDLKTDPSGDSGARIAGGVIQAGGSVGAGAGGAGATGGTGGTGNTGKAQ